MLLRGPGHARRSVPGEHKERSLFSCSVSGLLRDRTRWWSQVCQRLSRLEDDPCGRRFVVNSSARHCKRCNQRFRTPCVLWTRVALVLRWTLLLEAEETQMQSMTLPAPRQTCFKAVTTAHHVVVARSESVAKRIGQARVCVCDLLRSFALLPPFSICSLSFSPLCTRDAACNPNPRPLFL